MKAKNMKFVESYNYKGTKHAYWRRGIKITSPIVVFIDDKEWGEFATLSKAKERTLAHIKSINQHEV